jgi:prolyl-tRNA synthetase
LPLLINQWCNVVRWEMRTRMFLRTAEFLWQEGHTAHATKEEAEIETKRMLEVYSNFAHDYLAIPVIRGEKTESERFPGAVHTYCIEAMMQDKKALQAGTSHFLGQNFSRSCGIQFQNAAGERELAWTTSWGTTTRLIGGLIMVHSDDDGLVLPPRVASAHIAIVPIIHNAEARGSILSYCERLGKELRGVTYDGQPLRVVVDARDLRGGEKSWSWIKKGVPVRIEIGPREVEAEQFSVARRDRPHKETTPVKRAELASRLPELLEEIQKNLLEKATRFRDENTVKIDRQSDFDDFFKSKEEEIGGGFAMCHWNGDPAIEAQVKERHNVTIRCIPLDAPHEEGKCLFTGQKSSRRVLFAKAY